MPTVRRTAASTSSFPTSPSGTSSEPRARARPLPRGRGRARVAGPPRAVARHAPSKSVAAVCLALAAACAEGPTPAERALVELEQLAFVPADRVLVDSFLVRDVLYENVRPLLVDRFEVTRAQWREF